MAYEHGQWNVICDRCGFKYKARNLKREWNGLRTCSGPSTNNCYEPRHPQDLVRGKPDSQTIPWAKPEPEDVFITPGPLDLDAL